MFGYGIHSCLSAALARLEGLVTLQELAARYPKFEIDESGLQRIQMSNVAGFSHVPFHAGHETGRRYAPRHPWPRNDRSDCPPMTTTPPRHQSGYVQA